MRAERAQLIARASPLLAGAQRVASVDIGWVAVAADRQVVDLAGLTDPEVAYLSGGHTSKRLPLDFLTRRQVDALVQLEGLSPEQLESIGSLKTEFDDALAAAREGESGAVTGSIVSRGGTPRL